MSTCPPLIYVRGPWDLRRTTRDIKLSTAGDWAKHLVDMLLLTGYNTLGQVK